MKTEQMKWAPRVERRKILQFYEKIAAGIIDDELIDEIAYAFFARCESIIDVTEAALGRVKCPDCGEVIVRSQPGEKTERLTCQKCDWTIAWEAYFSSYHRKQLVGGNAYEVFKDFVKQLPLCRTPRDKMLLIDKIIHECHVSLPSADGTQLYTRAVAVNLIEGRMNQLIEFLENLPYGPGSHPAMRQNLIRWRKNVMSAIKSREVNK